jgi:hypothetical protein
MSTMSPYSPIRPDRVGTLLAAGRGPVICAAMTRRRIGLLLLFVVLLPAAGGCAFDRQWRAMRRAQFAAAQAGNPAPAEADPLAGRWEGKWVSEQNHHTGKLRAIVKPIDETTYRVDYDATFMAVLRYVYGMKLTASRQPDGTVRFEGEEDLGPLAGGVYHYTGTADGQTFTVTYKAPKDHGRFEMTRPRAE